jgi:hypothetical protein
MLSQMEEMKDSPLVADFTASIKSLVVCVFKDVPQRAGLLSSFNNFFLALYGANYNARTRSELSQFASGFLSR